jgi:MFS family permease
MSAGASPRFAPFSVLTLGLAVATTTSWGILFYAFSLFVTPMEADLGWSRTQLNGALSLGLLAAGAAAIPVGRWIDRHGGRGITTLGAALGAALLVAWAYVTDPLVFVLIWIGIGLAQAASLYEPAFAIITANIKDYKRAITYVSFLGGLASTIFIPLTSVLIGALGWRAALLVLAAIQLVFGSVTYLLVTRGTRGSLQGVPAPPAGTAEPSHLREALRRPAMWWLMLCFVAYGFGWSAVTFHVIPLLTERGVALAEIVAAIALIGPAQVGGRLLLFLFGAKASARDVGRVVMAIPALSILILILAAPHGFAGLAVFAVVYGIGNGMTTIVRGAGIAEIMGTAGYGQIAGAITLGNTIAKAAGPIALALLWDRMGSYDPLLWLVFGVMIAGSIAFLMAARRDGGGPS